MTPACQRGFDLMRRVRDNVDDINAKAVHKAERIDQIVLSPRINDMIRSTWNEMAPHYPVPTDFSGVPYVVGDTQGAGYLFLRDYTPWEKRKMLEDGSNAAYHDGAKKVMATGDV